MSSEALPDGLGFNFRHFIGGLCDMAATYFERNSNVAALIVAIISRLCRRRDRFLAILARFKAGTLRAPCPKGAGRAHDGGTASPRPPDPVPRCRGYLVRLLNHEAAVYGRILDILLADPEMVALLQASPQAGRLLRPLWRMLHRGPLPAVLRPVPQQPASSPRAAEPATPAPHPSPPRTWLATPGRRRAPVRDIRRSRPPTPAST